MTFRCAIAGELAAVRTSARIISTKIPSLPLPAAQSPPASARSRMAPRMCARASSGEESAMSARGTGKNQYRSGCVRSAL